MAIPFEGPEKKLEIILTHPMAALRPCSDKRWESIVDASGAEILSSTSTPALDAYLLSESSLFVWDDRILMITCGRTNLINAVPGIIDLVHRESIALFFYERKNLMYPQLQPSDFEVDVRRLSEYFTGKSYRIGPANEDHVHLFYSRVNAREVSDDMTFEILMHDLHPEVIAAFASENDSPADMEKQTGLDRLYPHMTNDSRRFLPRGYSMNKIANGEYATVHVTPEESGSYASFETNAAEPDFGDTLSLVLKIFRPQRFSAVLTASEKRSIPDPGKRLSGQAPGYRCTEKSFYRLDCGYAVHFCNFIDSAGVGETKGKEPQ